MSEKKTFFISRAGADKRWAELIASVVRDAGHEAIHQDQDFAEGTSFSHNMMLAAESDCTIAVLSPQYFESKHCLAELHAALAADPLGTDGLILPVLVAPVDLPRLIGHLAHVDLLGSKDDAARKRFMAALVKHGKLDVSKAALRGQTRRVVEQTSRNRSAMIEKVRTIWITGFLQKSLFHEIRIPLGLSDRQCAVARPFDLLVMRPDEGERPLPSGTRVVDIYESMDKAILILGAPGSGKTTELLELAKELLTRAAEDPSHPIPVIFPLSTWAETRKPLVQWLEDELNLRYDVPRKIAHEWMASDQVMPMLDGLDEVATEQRAACVEAINSFRQSHGLIPLAITSRTVDYEVLHKPLRLHGAILVRPLTGDQVTSYLADLGSAGEPVRTALHEESSLWQLLDSPLMLNIVTVAHSGKTKAPPLASGTMAMRRDYLFLLYVNQMLQRRTATRRYPPEQTVRCLNWLAHQMANRGQPMFYLEGLQFDWLPEKQQRAIRGYNALAFGLASWLIVGLVYELVSGRIDGLVCGLYCLIYMALGLGSDKIITCVENIKLSFAYFKHNISIYYVHAIVVGLVVGSSSG
jgi:TIR domain/NACHT domain